MEPRDHGKIPLCKILYVAEGNGLVAEKTRWGCTIGQKMVAVLAAKGAGVPQSLLCLTINWTTGRSRIHPRKKRKDFSCSPCVRIGCGAHPASCTVGTGDPFPGLKRGSGVMLTTHPI
jgi:hypothetical protein